MTTTTIPVPEELGASVQQPMSARRLEILTLLAQGLPSAEIGAKVHLTEHTIKTHLRRMFAATGTTSRAGLVGHAYRNGWLGAGILPAEPEPAEPEPPVAEPEPISADRRRVQRVHVALRNWTGLRNAGSAAATAEGLRRAVVAALDLPEQP